MMPRSLSLGPNPHETIGRPAMDRPIQVSVDDEREFQVALESYKQQSGRLFPTWSEVLEVLRDLGYAKRIWKPVNTWAPLPTLGPEDSMTGGDAMGLVGWFSRVETPVGP